MVYTSANIGLNSNVLIWSRNALLVFLQHIFFLVGTYSMEYLFSGYGQHCTDRMFTLLIQLCAVFFGVGKAVFNFITGVTCDTIGRKWAIIIGWCCAIPMPFMVLFLFIMYLCG